MTTQNESMVCDLRVQIDRSGGQGHCWRNVDAIDLPPSIREEIEAEMIDGGRNTAGDCDDYVASNGQHYRW